MVKHQTPSGSARAVVAALFLVLPICTAVSRAHAQDMDKQTENRVKQAAVQVWMGEAKQGEDLQRLGSGSGSFINRTGIVLTNNHVIDLGHGKDPRAKLDIRRQHSLLQYRVVINGGTDAEKEYKADVLYQNEAADLAVLQVVDADGNPLQTSANYLAILPSHGLHDGYRVWLFGFPGGDKMSTSKDKHAPVTISAGNITDVLHRPSGRIRWIETDVKAAPGNSGGPLVNSDGQLLGVVSQISVGFGTDNAKGDGVDSRIIPGDLVFDFVKVALGTGKISGDTDYEPFLHLLADKSGRAFLPGLDRSATKATVVLKNGGRLVGTVKDPELVWNTPLGRLSVPTQLAAYAVAEDGTINLLMDGGDRVSAVAGDARIEILTELGKTIKQSMADVEEVAFSLPEKALTPPNVDAILIEGDGCRLYLKDVDGTVKFKTEDDVMTLKLDEIRSIETKAFKQLLTTNHGSTFTGKFEPHQLTAKLAWIDTPINLSLEKIKFASIRHGNPAKAGRTTRALADRLAIDNRDLVEIAQQLERGELEAVSTALATKSAKNVFKDLPGPVQEQVNILQAETLLRQGKFNEAMNQFKKLRRAKLENARWYALSRCDLLERFPAGAYKGESLSNPQVFNQAAEAIALTSIERARSTLRAFQKVKPDKHSGWKDLKKTLESHEEELRMADSLDPGSGENDIFRIWRFTQDLNIHEIERLIDDREKFKRQIEDFKDDRSPQSRERLQGLITKAERLEDQFTDVVRYSEDIQKVMSTEGFRLDDPAAVDIL